jgi:5-methylcytosine-specific restriction endonuclease McrA
MKRTPLGRRAPLRAGRPLRRLTPLRRTTSMAATDAQRFAVAGRPCIACGSEHRVDAAHVIPRSLGCGDALDVVPLCRRCHAAYDAGELDLLPYLEPGFRAQVAHAVRHVGLIGALRRISGEDRRPTTGGLP